MPGRFALVGLSVSVTLLCACALEIGESGAEDADGTETSGAVACAAAAPCDLRVTGTTASTVSLAWNRPADTSRFGRYVVRGRVSGASSWTSLSSIGDPAVLTYTASGLASGTAHDFRVEQRSARGNKLLDVSNVVTATPAATPPPPDDGGDPTSAAPPPAGGYFGLVGPSAPATPVLPGDDDCAALVQRSSWEVRPENAEENATIPGYAAVQAAFAAAERTGFDDRWNTWLLQRVDGNFTGTTDEIIQWAACKWGLPDEVIRGVAVRESTWYEYLHFSDGTPYRDRGNGDFTTDDAWCRYVSGYGVRYANPCPQTYGLVGVKAREAGSGYLHDNNGAFPFNKDSTAFAVDFFGGEMRGCLEGWVTWLGGSYGPGDLWGCIGYWYSGEWHSADAEGYISRVKGEIAAQTWAAADFVTGQYQCDATLGCPE
jgi:hypothetical protein